jgi:PadR family transcriptional regulator, regulatory protein PadR
MPTEANYIENVKLQMRKGNLEYCILLTISNSEMYATDILNRLKEFDLIVVEGTLYPILSRLRESGLLTYTWVESSEGPPRKYYKLSAKGEDAVKLLTEEYQGLHKSINQLIKRS